MQERSYKLIGICNAKLLAIFNEIRGTEINHRLFTRSKALDLMLAETQQSLSGLNAQELRFQSIADAEAAKTFIVAFGATDAAIDGGAQVGMIEIS